MARINTPCRKKWHYIHYIITMTNFVVLLNLYGTHLGKYYVNFNVNNQIKKLDVRMGIRSIRGQVVIFNI